MSTHENYMTPADRACFFLTALPSHILPEAELSSLAALLELLTMDRESVPAKLVQCVVSKAHAFS